MHGQRDLVLAELAVEGGLHHVDDAPDGAVILRRIKGHIDDSKEVAGSL